MFSQDNKIVMIANKVTELIILSCIWLAACIPLITTGAACASAYNAVIKTVRRDTGYIWKEFPAAMWENLKGMWLLTLGLYAAAGVFAAIAVRLWPVRDSFFGGVYFFMSCFLALTVILYAVHLFCLCGRFPLPRKALCKVALWMTFSRPLNNLLLAFVILGSIWMTLNGGMIRIPYAVGVTDSFFPSMRITSMRAHRASSPGAALKPTSRP